MLGATSATPITVKPFAPSHGRGNRAQPENLMLPKSVKPLNGGARHTIDLRARRSFEHNGCS